MANPNDERGGGIAEFSVGFGNTTSAQSGRQSADRVASGDLFRILVIGGFTADLSFAAAADPAAPPLLVTAATFDEVMTRLAPTLTIEVPDPAELRGKPLRVDLSFSRLRSFRPDVLVQEVTAFRGLRGDDVGEPSPAISLPPASPAAGSLIDDILGGMGVGPSAPTVAQRSARRNTEMKGALLQSILNHPEVRRLERSWRGLKLLVDRAARGCVTVQIVNAAIDDVEKAARRHSKFRDGSSVDLIVVDYELGPNALDLERGATWAACAEAVPVPLITNVTAEAVGFDDLKQLATTHRRIRALEGPRAVAFRALTEKEATRWLVLAMNGVLLREAYTSENARLRDIPFEGDVSMHGGAAWIVAAAAANAFEGCGWACALTEGKWRNVGDLQLHLTEDRGSAVSVATECFVSPDVAGEAAQAGLTVVTGVRDRDIAAVPFAQMVYRGAVRAGGIHAPAELTLADQLFVARLVPLVTELAAVIPEDSDGSAARDTARIALLSVFGTSAAEGPSVDAALVRGEGLLQVTIKPRGFRGVKMEEITLNARLG